MATPSKVLIGQDEKNSYKPTHTVKIIQQGKEVQIDHPELVQLPIERLNPQSLTLNGNTQLCTFCEYFLHYLQQEITEPKNEVSIISFYFDSMILTMLVLGAN